MSIIVERLNKAIMQGPIETPAWVVNTMRDAAERIAELEAAAKLKRSEHWLYNSSYESGFLDGERASKEYLRQQIAALREQVLNWTETAAQYARNQSFYEGLLDQCAAYLGPEVYVSDDGSVQDSPLRLKIPEMLQAMAEQLARMPVIVGYVDSDDLRLLHEMKWDLHIPTSLKPDGEFKHPIYIDPPQEVKK